jgi:thiol-disulfide isomerase/thioredoxin
MAEQIERALPLLAAWGAWIFAALLAAALLGIWRLGRGRRLLVPARWPARFGSAGLFLLALVFGGGIYLLLGPMRPMLDQVRYIEGTVGRPAGDLGFRQVKDDAPRRLSELQGKVVLVNLWATWCPPCRKELPEIDKLQKAYADRGLVVVTLSDEERARLLEFAAEHPLTTLNVYASELGWLNVGGRPLSLVIDRGGVVRECIIGGRSYAEFEAKVAKYLAG